MPQFAGFSEAARLYAENAKLVDAMRLAFQRDVDEFLDSVQDEMASRINLEAAPLQLQHRVTKGYKYWWIGEDEREQNDYPQLWINRTLPEIVHPGTLVLTAISPKAQGDQLSKLSAIGLMDEFKSCCSPGGKPWNLFVVRITGLHDPKTSETAGKIADILVALTRANTP